VKLLHRTTQGFRQRRKALRITNVAVRVLGRDYMDGSSPSQRTQPKGRLRVERPVILGNTT